jgi:hypothetical protein
VLNFNVAWEFLDESISSAHSICIASTANCLDEGSGDRVLPVTCRMWHAINGTDKVIFPVNVIPFAAVESDTLTSAAASISF